MQNWLKCIATIGLASLSTIACAHAQEPPTPAPAAQPAPPTPPSANEQTRAEAQAARARTEVRAAQDQHRAAEAAVERGVTLGMPGGKKEKVAFLGITTTRVSPALRANLDLQRGVGLVVETVGKDTPAEKAGLQRYDILQKMDDQLLIFPEQLGVLTRLHKSGDEVTLSVMRKGQPQQIKISLGEKEMYVNDEGQQVGSLFPADANSFVFAPQAQGLGQIGDKLKILRDKVHDSSANYIFQDGDMTLEITKKNDAKALKATDKDGKVLFEGPIQTAEERKAVPENVAKRLTKLEDRIKALPADSDQDVKVRVLEP